MLDTPNDIVHWTRTNLFDILFQEKKCYWVFVMWIKQLRWKLINEFFHNYKTTINEATDVYEIENKNQISFILHDFEFYFIASWKNVFGHKVFCAQNTYDLMVKILW